MSNENIAACSASETSFAYAFLEPKRSLARLRELRKNATANMAFT